MRRFAVLALAGVAVVLGAAGCGDRAGAAPAAPGPAPTAVTASVTGSQVDDVAGAVDGAQRLLGSIDAELAQDDAGD